jgi:hypothetical protein
MYIIYSLSPRKVADAMNFVQAGVVRSTLPLRIRLLRASASFRQYFLTFYNASCLKLKLDHNPNLSYKAQRLNLALSAQYLVFRRIHQMTSTGADIATQDRGQKALIELKILTDGMTSL